MTRRLDGKRLVVASHNAGKVREVAELLEPYGIVGVPVSALGLEEPEETGATFRANAELKARAAVRAGLPALADDSGLAVTALGGAPGIRSARWAGPDRAFSRAMAAVHERLGDRPRAAAFVAALALVWPDGHAESFEGRVEGRLVWPPRGEQGFGYDPIFVPDGHDETFGEMDPETKARISHRARAFAKLAAACFP